MTRWTPVGAWDRLIAISVIVEVSIVIEDLLFWEFQNDGLTSGTMLGAIRQMQDGSNGWKYGGYGEMNPWGGNVGIGFDLSTPAIGVSSGNLIGDIITET